MKNHEMNLEEIEVKLIWQILSLHMKMMSMKIKWI